YSGNTNIGVSISNNIATLTYSGTWTGSENIAFKATDLAGQYSTSTATFIVNAAATNHAPTVAQIPGQTITKGSDFLMFDLKLYGSDQDSGDTIAWSYSGNVNLTVSIDSNNGVTITAPTNWTGSRSITFTATDSHGATASSTAVFAVNAPGDCTNM